MKLLSLRNRISVSPWGTKLSSEPHSGPKSPLDIPEILERILLLLDERTIRNTTRFVCKLWFVVSSRLALWEVAWDDNREPLADLDSVLVRLPRAGALTWGVSDSKRSWAKLEKVLKDKANRDRQPCSRLERVDEIDPNSEDVSVMQSQRDPLTVSLRQLRLYGKSNYIEYLDTILPSLWALTSLSLTFVNKFEINPLLESCPSLQRLRLEGYNHPSELTEIQVSESKGVLPVMTRLKTLFLRDVYIPIPTLERLLKLAAPTLVELKLIRLITWLVPLTTLHFGHTPAVTEHTNQLTQFFSTLDTTLLPHLHTLHLSPKTNSMSQRQSCILALIKPNVSRIKEWGFCLDDASPFLFARLQTVGHVITSLDLTHGITPTNNNLVRLRLHAFLCNAPSLLYLKAPRVHIAPMDLFFFRESAARASAVDVTKIWACRRLQTLEIGMDNRVDTDSSSDEDEARRARVLFGFLSRVLPQLRVLELNMSSTNLQLNTGFCLLARLAQLEQVRVVLMGSVFYWSKKPDLGWMADPRKVGRCMRAKWNWQQGQVTARWKDAVMSEVELIKVRRVQLRAFWNLGDNTIVRKDAQWENQGLLTDVKQVLDDIKDGKMKKTGPWPKLYNFRIYVARSVETGMEEMIQAVRPGIDMSSDYDQIPPF